MFKHPSFCWSFLRKVIKNGFIESIKIKENMIFKEQIENNSLSTAVKFWISFVSKDKIFTEFSMIKVKTKIIYKL